MDIYAKVNMIWHTGEFEWEGFPLHLRKPGYQNIWQYQSTFTQLTAFHHILEEVKPNGLPYPDYNDSLLALDQHLVGLFEKSDQGKIFLIETFGGKRNYYFYTVPEIPIEIFVKELEDQFNVLIQTSVKDDSFWDFIKNYPIKLF